MAEQRYKIYEKMGAGGVGAVFRAYDSQLKRWVAIKRLLTATEANSNDLDTTELRREADTLASLRNPNIVTIFDVGSDEEGLFIVMELLEGEDLADVVERGPLGYDDFKELATQCLEGLMAAHQNHILHRDIKPENIKVERLPGGRMQAKIIDFGLARAGMRARKQTEDQSGTVMGSIFYMAPEQLTREPVDARTDLYSLGCVFYEALSGKKAFNGESMNDVIDAHIDHRVTPLHEVAPYVQPWLSAWVFRLISAKPEDRPADAQQAIEEFRAWEKMPVLPVGPWMPMAYYPPPYGVPAPYPEASYAPVSDASAHYAQDPNGSAPVYVQPDDEPIVKAIAVEPPSRVTRPASSPVAARPAGRVPSSPVRPTSSTPTPSATLTEAAAKKKKMIMIGAGVAGLLLILGFIFGRGGGAADSGGAATTSALGPSGPPKLRFELPVERAFPLMAQTLVAHFVAGKGPVSARKDDKGNPAEPNANEAVFEWHDLSTLGNDNLLRSFNGRTEHSPKRLNWPSQANAAGAKPNRLCLDFRLRDGVPSAMNLTDPASMAESFPFGSNTQVDKFTFSRGLTVAVALQAHAPDLPTRVLTLISEDGSTLSLKVDENKNFVAEARAAGSSVDIVSKDVNASTASIASISWGSNPAEIQLRARDATGKTFRSPVSAIGTPAKPMTKVQIGRVIGSDGKPVAKQDSFSGFIGEVMVFSMALQPSQMDGNEGQLREQYLQTATKK
jgi:serine/threonine protein kinase